MNLPFTSDLVTQYLPWYYLTSRSLKNFTLPHWVDQLYGGGYPLLAQGETGVLSPINSTILLIFPFDLSIVLLYLIYAGIAFWGMVFFLKSQKLNRLSRVFGGAIFILSGFMVSRYFQPAIIFSAALLPWGMTLVALLSKNLRSMIILPFVIFLQLTAGHAQITFISILGYIGLATTQIILKKMSFKNILPLLFAITIGLGLSAIQLFPSFKLYSISARQNWDPMVRFTYSLPLSHLVTYFSPEAFGISQPGDNLGFGQSGGSFWEFNLTIWTLPFILSLVSIAAFKHHKNTIVTLFILWLVFLLLSLGGNFVPYRLLARSPSFPFRAPSRFLLIATFAASALSAHGFSFIAKKLPNRKKIAVFSVVIGATIIQLANQLSGYVITQSSSRIFPAITNRISTNTLTTPLPLRPEMQVTPQDFIIGFHQGAKVSLLSLTLLYIWSRTIKNATDKHDHSQ